MGVEKKALRVETAAEMYDMHPKILRALCLTKKIKASKIGNRWYIPTEEMERLFKEGLKGGPKRSRNRI